MTYCNARYVACSDERGESGFLGKMRWSAWEAEVCRLDGWDMAVFEDVGDITVVDWGEGPEGMFGGWLDNGPAKVE